jgi:hypothetical protein
VKLEELQEIREQNHQQHNLGHGEVVHHPPHRLRLPQAMPRAPALERDSPPVELGRRRDDPGKCGLRAGDHAQGSVGQARGKHGVEAGWAWDRHAGGF